MVAAVQWALDAHLLACPSLVEKRPTSLAVVKPSLRRFMQDGGNHSLQPVLGCARLLSCRPFSPFSAIAASILRAACSIAQPLAFQVFLHIGEDQFVLTYKKQVTTRN